MKMNVTKNHLPAIKPGASARDIIRAGINYAGEKIKFASSFSIEDVVAIDLLQRFSPQVSVFALDTGRLPEETYETAEAVSQRYGIKIEWYFPRQDAVEKLEREKGLFSFRENIENRKECCAIRKIEPLQRALSGLNGWITGMRQEQGVTRTGLRPLELDSMHGGILKINPLAFWSWQKVQDYADKHRLPINRLHQQGYPSIGCAPCTRAVSAGEDLRAGRWWWENAEYKECGLHRR